jgi:predicted kinase
MQNKPTLYILCGLPYSGKTTLQKELVKRLGLQAVSVDRIMDERDMWREGHPTQEDWNEAYSEAYGRIEAYLKAGKTVIFDCANLPFHERENARMIAERLGIMHKLIYLNIPREEILRRWQENKKTQARSQLGQEMMESGFDLFDKPTESEHPILYNQQMDLDDWIERLFH